MAAAIVLLTLATFHRLLDSEFVAFDDATHISANKNLAPLSRAGLRHLWAEPYAGLYVPVAYTFFAAEAWLAQGIDAGGNVVFDPRVFNAGLLLLHATCAVLVFFILRLLVRHNAAAMCGALLFALHPLQVESTAWISETRGALGAALALAAMYAYLRFRLMEGEISDYGASSAPARPRSLRWRRVARWSLYTAASLAFVLAILSKPSTVTTPLLLVVIDVGWYRRPPARTLQYVGWWFVPGLAISRLTSELQSLHIDALVHVPVWWQRPLVALDALSFYVQKLFVPIGLGIDHGRTPERVLASPWIFLWALVPLAIVAVLAWLPHRRVWLTSAGIFVAGLATVLGFMAFQHQQVSTVADRYVYLSMLGPALALAWLLSHSRARTLRFEVAAALVLLALASARQAEFWHDTKALAEHTLEVNPRSPVCLTALAQVRFDEGDFASAETLFQRAVEVDPDAPLALTNLGSFYERINRDADAVQVFSEAITRQQGNPLPRLYLARVLLRQSEYERVVNDMHDLLGQNPDLTEAHGYVAAALAKLGRHRESIEHWRAVLRSEPENINVQILLGELLVATGDVSAARDAFLQAVALRPDDPRARERLRQLDGLGSQPLGPQSGAAPYTAD